MTTKIGLISDVHATPKPVAEALALFEAEGVDDILCPGDIAGYGDELDETVDLLIASGCRAILGNHDLLYLEDARDDRSGATVDFLQALPSVLELTIEGRRLYMVHAHPPRSCHGGIKLLDERGDIRPEQQRLWSERLRPFPYDVLVVGHTHQLFAERLGDTLVINPGSTQFNHSCAILSLPDLEVRIFPLSNQTLLKSWNWGAHPGPRRQPTDR